MVFYASMAYNKWGSFPVSSLIVMGKSRRPGRVRCMIAVYSQKIGFHSGN